MDVLSRLLSTRICAGRHLAQDTLSLMFASILHVYTIEPLVEGITAVKFTSNFISYVLFVSVLTVSRFDTHAAFPRTFPIASKLEMQQLWLWRKMKRLSRPCAVHIYTSAPKQRIYMSRLWYKRES